MQNKINYLRIILTEKCNLSCPYCHKEGCLENEKNISKEDTIKLLKCFYKVGIHKFKFMGGEPTLRTDLVDILYGMSEYSKNIDISMITNGLFEIPFIEKCFNAGLKRVNVSVHGWTDTKKLKSINMTLTKKEKFLKNLDYLILNKKLTKLNYIFLKSSLKTEIIDLINTVHEKNLVLDLLNILYNKKHSYLSKEYCSFDEIQNFLKDNYKILKIYNYQNKFSLPSKRIALKNGGEINLKTEMLNSNKPFNSCSSCPEFNYCKEGIKAIRLTSDGYLKPCLFRDDNKLNLMTFINEPENKIIDKILNYIQIL